MMINTTAESAHQELTQYEMTATLCGLTGIPLSAGLPPAEMFSGGEAEG